MTTEVLGVAPECQMGYTAQQIKKLMGDQLDEFTHWMRGQTIGVCEGRFYDRKAGKYRQGYVETEDGKPVRVVACGGVAHGPAYYPHDVARFLRGLPVVD